jgi:hypothetical protein
VQSLWGVYGRLNGSLGDRQESFRGISRAVSVGVGRADHEPGPVGICLMAGKTFRKRRARKVERGGRAFGGVHVGHEALSPEAVFS